VYLIITLVRLKFITEHLGRLKVSYPISQVAEYLLKKMVVRDGFYTEEYFYISKGKEFDMLEGGSG